VRPRPGTPTSGDAEYDGFTVRELAATAPAIPYVRNYFKNERLWAQVERDLAARLESGGYDVVHAQHVLTTVPAIRAGRRRRVPVVATVRDYWPVCYWSDLIIDPDSDALCPECTASNMTRCIRPRAGAAWPLALPMIPYMRANLSRKRSGLAGRERGDRRQPRDRRRPRRARSGAGRERGWSGFRTRWTSARFDSPPKPATLLSPAATCCTAASSRSTRAPICSCPSRRPRSCRARS
jgi:hypothetical protein